MSWQEKYKDKICTPEEAVAHIQSGDKIIFGDWIGEPKACVDALTARHDELRNVEIIHGMSPGDADYLQYEESFHHTSVFLGPSTRKGYREGKVDFIGGTCFHKWPKMFAESEKLNPHWALVQLSYPDEDGMCTFGNSCCFTEPAVRTATKVIAQVNHNMPETYGEKISLDKIDYIVPYDEPIYTIGRAQVDETTRKIAENVAALVEDGATIQLGIGSLPDSIAQLLKDKKHLGVHSETLTESIMELMECGAIDNSMKTINKGVCVCAQAAGSKEFFEYLRNNPKIMLRPVDYVNDPYVVGQNYKQTSINSCIQVDLLGQVNSEYINGDQYSGIGGQLDHVRGSQLSEGGISILALNSTAKGGTISKIVPKLPEGSIVTVPRYDVDKIVTEYGVAELKYKTTEERAKALIAIAAPKFRDELTAAAKEMNIIRG